MRILFGEPKKQVFGEFACFINPKYVPDLSTVEFAVKKTLKNWNSGKRISKSLAMEILLYYSASRQINIAKKLAGTKKAVAVVIDEEEFSKLEFKELDFVPDFDLNSIMEHYGITEEELKIAGLEKLPLLIRERIALFSAFGD